MTGNARPAPRLIGSLRAENGKGSVRMEDRFDTGIEDVRSALTEPERLACWLGTVEGDLRVGVAICTFFYAGEAEGPGHVDVCDPPNRFVVTLGSDSEEQHVVEARLTADGATTLVNHR